VVGKCPNAPGTPTQSPAQSPHAAVEHKAATDALAGQGIYSLTEIFTLIGLLGFPVLAAALWRSRMVHRAVPLLLLVSVVSFFLPIPEAAGGALIAAAFGWLGVSMFAARDTTVAAAADLAAVPA